MTNDADPLPLPADLVAVQADDAMLDALFVLTNQAADATRPDIDLDGILTRVLVGWRDEVESEPMAHLIDVDTALHIVGRGPRPRWYHRIYYSIVRWWFHGRKASS